MESLTLREILRQPHTWREAAQRAADAAPQTGDLLARSGAELVLFTGCGSSYYLAIAAAGFFQEVTGLAARAVPSSELILSAGTYLPRNRPAALVAFSRSGTTTETVTACRLHREAGRGPVIGVTCHPGSDLEQLADIAITLPGADDQSVVMTSSFSSMLLAAFMVAASLGDSDALRSELAALPAQLERDLEALRSRGETLGADRQWSQFVFLGIGPFLGAAYEAMLKLKEMTQVPCEAYSPLDFRHGPISIVGKGTMAVLLDSDRAAAHERSVLEDIRRLGGDGLMLSEAVGQGHSEMARSLLYLPVVQCLAYYRAIAEGRDPDRPQHLSRVVVLGEPLA